MESNPGKENVQCYNSNARGYYAHDCPKPKVHEAKYFKEQMMMAMKDEAGGNLNDEENDFMLNKAYGDDTLEELTAAVIMMIRHIDLLIVDADEESRVEFRRIFLIGFRSCASRSQIGASQSRQSTDCELWGCELTCLCQKLLLPSGFLCMYLCSVGFRKKEKEKNLLDRVSRCDSHSQTDDIELMNGMKSSFHSLKKSVVNISNTSTNKAFQVPTDPSRLQSPFNSRHKLFAPCHILLSPKSHIHTQIEPFSLEFLNSVIQCFQNACQRTITELVYFVESRDLSFIVVDREHYRSRRLNDGIIMLELVAFRIPSWFSEVQLFLNQKDDQDDLAEGADLGLQSHWDTGFDTDDTKNSEITWRTTKRQWSADIDSDLITFWIRLVYLISKHLVTLLHLELQYQFMKVVMSPILASNEFLAGGS
ncbi:hypothetical protein Tco_0597208 [Tanacetum coccineum]